MRIFVLVLYLSFISSTAAQTEKFTNTFPLREGIYTSYQEFLNNAPSFPDCVLHASQDKLNDPDNINLKKLTYSVSGHESNTQEYTSPLFATVQEGKLNVYYQNELTTVYAKGTICTFIFVKDPVYDNKYTNSNINNGYNGYNTVNAPLPRQGKHKSSICILDIQTGKTSKLSKENLGLTIMRDSVLYQRYLKIKPGKRNKNLLMFIIEFNERNATFLPTRETAVIEGEE